jgi:hypothetical protein
MQRTMSITSSRRLDSVRSVEQRFTRRRWCSRLATQKQKTGFSDFIPVIAFIHSIHLRREIVKTVQRETDSPPIDGAPGSSVSESEFGRFRGCGTGYRQIRKYGAIGSMSKLLWKSTSTICRLIRPLSTSPAKFVVSTGPSPESTGVLPLFRLHPAANEIAHY